MASLPQHLLNQRYEASQLRRRALLAATCCLSLASSSAALSLPASPPVPMQSQSAAAANAAWLTTLFDDDMDSSSASSSAASLADRLTDLATKDATPSVLPLASAKGADGLAASLDSSSSSPSLNDLESVLQRQAQQRRAQVTASQPRAGRLSPLTKEYEYTLAHAIQAGVQVHEIKSEYESIHRRTLSKKEWAALAGMDTAGLRRTIAQYRSAKSELVQSNLGLVHAVARQFHNRPSHKDVTLDELIQEGSLGLIRAAELFDPTKNLRFSTYATIWIKGFLQNQRLGQFVVLPNAEKKMWGQIRATVRDLEKEEGGGGENKMEITSQIIADKLGLKKEKVEGNIRRMTSVANVLSLDYQYDSLSRSGLEDQSRSNEAFLKDADIAEATALKADVLSALVSNLTPRERKLIRLLYGLHDGKEYTVKDSAEILGMNKETCRLLHKSCLKKLREAKGAEALQEYLLTVA